VTPRVWKATPEEAPDVARLLAAFRTWYGKPTEGEQMLPAVEQLIARDDTDFLLAGDGPHGFTQVRYRLSAWTGTDDCWIEDVFVDDAARGTGLGRAMVAAVIERARARGCGRVELDVDVVNEPARALYGSLGFRDKSEGGSLLLQHWLT
jgi:GNAT superfamily N-acetyltransferase